MTCNKNEQVGKVDQFNSSVVGNLHRQSGTKRRDESPSQSSREKPGVETKDCSYTMHTEFGWLEYDWHFTSFSLSLSQLTDECYFYLTQQ
jgi:hypothetical protein